jgi:TRAP-type C4-dicarboxylate transport system permease small subunit
MLNVLVHFIHQTIQKLLILMMLAIVLTVSWQVFSRFILQSPSSFTEELSRFLLIWIGVLGASYAYFTRAHLGLDLFVNKLSPNRKRKIMFLNECIVMLFAILVLVHGGFSLVSLTLELEQTSATLGIQIAWVYSVLPLSGCLITLHSINNAIRLIKSNGEE